MELSQKKDSNGSDNKKPINPAGNVNLASGGGSPCHICSETGHIVITTAKGKKIVPYYVCKKFNEMSPIERFSG
jgi:hypothetical protein